MNATADHVANLAAAFFQSCVDFHVPAHVTTVPETFLTDGAAERFLSCVKSHVADGVSFLRKCFATKRATKRFLSSMNSHVCFEVWLSAEPLTTFGTAERSLNVTVNVDNSEVVVFPAFLT